MLFDSLVLILLARLAAVMGLSLKRQDSECVKSAKIELCVIRRAPKQFGGLNLEQSRNNISLIKTFSSELFGVRKDLI